MGSKDKVIRDNSCDAFRVSVLNCNDCSVHMAEVKACCYSCAVYIENRDACLGWKPSCYIRNETVKA
jgi:hypothetical protein